ncbi:hypothetical protein G4B88_007046 [Cannabis sativa]|uniref:AAA+ ATPase domain-containing protein n=1 Tax=Cannabis sativa TaxID=3483 RepID=A0A7J6FNT1_CANSA|nr:hypothetical protein G4B88_007046 [Cannabis sativa]
MACIGEIAVGVASAILGKIGEYTVAPVGRQLGYLFRYTTNVSELQTQLEDLNNATQRMERRVNEALNNCHEIEADVQTWQKNAEQISGEATTFLNAETHAKALCSCGSPHHLVTRHQLSRKANKMSINVRELLSKNKEFDSKSISFPRRPEDSSATPTKGYESFYSRGEILKSILAAVGDGNRKRIGLHGMGGIGKTMLAKEIARLAEEDKLFSKVVMTTVSQTPNIKEIQQHIAEKLGLKLEEKDSTGKRAELLGMRLKQDESKILLILDDIWNELDLEAIGIHEECRMLITSRDQQVLRNFMGVAESNVFLIGALESSEAINLFIKIIGDTKTDYINALALEIVNECGGLPIAIATVAHALKYKKEEAIWKDALRRLKSSDLNDNVYKSIKLSYDFLGDHEKEAKPLLLLCALHKEDEEIQVEDLTRYSMGWCLLEDIYRVEDARNRVNLLVDKLKTHCLLLDGRSKSTVKMHDVIRDVCIKIAKEDHGHRMMKNIAMCEDERTKASKAISFVDYDDFDNLPQILECPSLELLLLSSAPTLESIPDEFFKQTGLLKVLIMNPTRLRSLPSSFASLQNLQTLCMRGSDYLKDIAVIGVLKNLKALDLSWTDSIQRLPKELGELRRLQLLDLRGCYKLGVIEANVISKLTQMEELYLPRGFKGWDQIIDEEGGIRNASLIEIKSMQRLTALHLYVPPEHVLPEGLFSEKLERYQICIGVEYPFLFGDDVSSKWLGLSLSQLDQVYARELVSLMRRSECLSLAGSMSINNGDPSLVNEGFPRLKHLKFDDNDGVQCIINSTEVAFPCLESLRLKDLRSLESIICHGGNKLPRGSFNQLRKVQVKYCGRLKNLFPLCVAKLLHEIKVQCCEMMEEIIVREDGDEVGHNIDDHSSSLQLRSLNLTLLPKLVQFYCSNHRAAEESDHPKPFFSETVSFPNLEALTMKGMNIEKLWPDQLIVSSTSYMQNLTTLEVEMCHNLKYVFSFSLAQKFVNLQSIRVGYCEAMEDIIRVVDQPGEEETTHHNDQVCFPKLEDLTMKKMEIEMLWPEQLMLSSTSSFYMQNLTTLEVEGCDSLKYVFSFSLAQKFVNLKSIEVKYCEGMEDIIRVVDQPGEEETTHRDHDQMERIDLFPKLQSLELVGLSSLQRFCSATGSSPCMVFPLLSKLTIRDCSEMKAQATTVSTQEPFFSKKVCFPNLEDLTMKKMDIEMLWPEQLMLSSTSSFYMQNLTSLKVGSCHNLKYLFSSSVAQKFVNLKSIKVKDCEAMEDIVRVVDQPGEEESTHDHDQIERIDLLPKLESVKLVGLSSLQTFCTATNSSLCMVFPLLSKLDIINCSTMEEQATAVSTQGPFFDKKVII